MQGDPTYKGVAVVPAPGGGAHLKRVDDAVSAFSHATANSLGHAHLTDHFARSRSGFGTSRDSQAPVGRQMPWEQRTDLLVAGVRDRLPRMSSDMVREGPPRHGHSPYGSLAERRMSMDGTRVSCVPRQGRDGRTTHKRAAFCSRPPKPPHSLPVTLGTFPRPQSVSAPRPPRHPSREPGHSRRVSFHESVEEITRHRTGLPSRGVSPVGLRDVAEAQNQGKKGKKTSKKKKKKKAR